VLSTVELDGASGRSSAIGAHHVNSRALAAGRAGSTPALTHRRFAPLASIPASDRRRCGSVPLTVAPRPAGRLGTSPHARARKARRRSDGRHSDQCRGHRPIGQAREVGTGAVDRIDNPHVGLVQSGGIVLGLSDSQPTSCTARSRSRSSASTARSASLTGDEPPLVQLLSSRRKVCSARAPASRTAPAS